MTGSRGRRMLPALLVAAVLLAACSSSEGGATTSAPPCRLPEDLSGTAVLHGGVDRELVTVDVASGVVTVVCRGIGSPAGRDAPELSTLDGRSYRYSEPVPAAASDRGPVSDDLSFAVAGGDVVDLRTGERTTVAVPAGSGWEPAYVTDVGSVVLVRYSREDRTLPADPAAWCVLPQAAAPFDGCQPVASANGPGTAVVAGGEVGWAPAVGVPLVAGPVQAGTATGALGRVAAIEVTAPPETGAYEPGVSLDAPGTSGLVGPDRVQAVLSAGGDAPISWIVDVTVGADQASARWVQSLTTYRDLGALVLGPGLTARVGGFRTDGPDSIIVTAGSDREGRGASLVRVHGDGSAPQVVLAEERVSGTLPNGTILHLPPRDRAPA